MKKTGIEGRRGKEVRWNVKPEEREKGRRRKVGNAVKGMRREGGDGSSSSSR